MQPSKAEVARQTVDCPICESPRSRPAGTKEGFQVVSCVTCGFWFISPRPTEEDYRSLYSQPKQYHFDRQCEVGHPEITERVEHDYTIAILRLRHIRKHVNQGRLLDVGCSNGAFVRRACEEGFDAEGMELDPWVVDFAREVNGVRVRCGELTELAYQSKTFDVVTLHDVIEHFYYPDKDLREVKRIMRPNGLLVIEAPDHGCPEAIAQGIHWKHVRPKEHLSMFQRPHLHRLLARQGFRVVDERHAIPGKLALFSRARGVVLR